MLFRSRVETYKLAVFVLSAMMAGVAGALYVPQVGIINPGEFAPANSIEAVIWVAVGGRGTLVGAALGAVLVNWGKTFFTGALPEYWLFALGALFVVNNLNFDGNAPGADSEVQISENGALSYRLDNGQSINAFQLGIANVAAPSRLSNQTGNAYLTTSASGQMMIGAPGTGGFGAIQSSSLEASTVDLANELSAMIIAQRTFAANSQSFQVASEILQILNNLK